ncbi:MAG TPA: carbohydrate ABC transporter permease [Candidatus Aerophobetes bacterium]|uniref:Carbohydrate ABC transporter permease n=1 Tax=Aerophobetes bacterium TaxID=2030807 RepID=A0A662DAC4_UNCAE|nr:MAG: carbohydrate ABC transporter permease [Candidatus Aerophobetes bacterium]HDN84388.1 carbohydrate ABC transporter permease [Candidatus Aerophobetes bacterium]
MKKRKTKSILKFYGLLVIAFLIIFPVVWFFLLSIKSQRVAFASPPPLIFTPTLSAYKEVFFSYRSLFPKYLMNSVIIASANTIFCLLVGLPAAYSFVRFRFKGRKHFMVWILIVRMFPPIAMILPLYLIVNRLRLLDTHLSLILAYMIYNLPFVIWTMKGFLQEIPQDLDESAMIDGCSRLGAFYRVVLPLATPGLIVTSVLNFILSWNEFMWASVLTGVNAKTMTVAIAGFWTNVTLDWTKIGAASTVFILPPLIIVLFFRNYMVRGLTMGAVKG